jgi:hypothetical protein
MTSIPLEVPIDYDALANAFLDGIQHLHDDTDAKMGALLNVGASARRRLAAMAAVPDKLILAMAQTLDEQPGLAGLSPRSSLKMREIIAFTHAVSAITDVLERLARTYHETIIARRADVVEDVLRMYQVAKSMNRASDLQQYFPQVEALKEALGPRGRKGVSKKAKAAAAAALTAGAVHAVVAQPDAAKGAK